MKNIQSAFRRHVGYVTMYPFTTIILLASCIAILITSYYAKTFTAAIAYIITSWFCCFLTDIIIYAKANTTAIGFPIKKAVGKELLTIIICTLLGAIFLCIRFFSNWEHLTGIVKLALIPLIVFTFPIVLAIIYLFIYKYKPRQLGVNFNYWYLPVLLHLVWGGITLWIAPEKSHWHEAWKEYGILGTLFTGIITAALPEEFTRMLLQTRIGKIVNSPAAGLFVATVIWSAMHIPVGYDHTHQRITFGSALEEATYLVPIGMFWGYLTFRTRSLLPATLMHGFNLWGLQNF